MLIVLKEMCVEGDDDVDRWLLHAEYLKCVILLLQVAYATMIYTALSSMAECKAREVGNGIY